MPKFCRLFLLLFVYSCGSGVDYYNEDNLAENKEILYETINIPSGEICKYGGYLINIGYDLNADGILDQNEIIIPKTICAETQNTAITISPLDPGKECPQGGILVQVGPDLDNDGIIDDDMTTIRKPVCNPPAPDKPLPPISVSYNKNNLCDSDTTFIKNNTDETLLIDFISNANLSYVSKKQGFADEYPKEQQFPATLAPKGEIPLYINIQPENEGRIDLLYAIKVSGNNQAYIFNEIQECNIDAVGKIDTIFDIVDRIQGIYIFSRDTNENQACSLGKECLFGIPYGIRKGLYPIEVKVNWEDGKEDLMTFRNISSAPLMSHTYSSLPKDNQTNVTVSIKTKTQTDFKSTRYIIFIN